MDRRSFLGLAASLFVSGTALGRVVLPNTKVKRCGWMPSHLPTTLPPLYTISSLRSYGEDKSVALWKAWEKVNHRLWEPQFQVAGDCVSHASGAGVDILDAVQNLKNRAVGNTIPSSTIAIYAGGRHMPSAKKELDEMGGGEGMCGKWAVDYLMAYGNLLRKPYPPYDLTVYNKKELDYWDRNGLTPALLEEAKKQPVKTCALVSSWNEIRDSVSAGHPVIFCSTMGLEGANRDSDGFVQPSGTWYHSMVIAGVQDGKRPGALFINSHGPNFGKGPLPNGQPVGSVWIDAANVDKYVLWRNRDGSTFSDSFAFADYKGFVKPDKEYHLW